MQTNKELKTSEDWQKLFNTIIVLDPDGWDRKNFKYSWYEEKITEDEYFKRRDNSTIRELTYKK
jgi:hypothetical protein